MSELFDEEDKIKLVEDESVDIEEIVEVCPPSTSDARRRLEKLMEEKRLRDELKDFSDY